MKVQHLINAAIMSSLLGAAPFALAKAGAINLKMNSFKEQIVTNKDGSQSVKLNKIDSAVPGDKIVYITEYTNISNKKVDAGAVITNRVPSNTHYVDNSAYCDGCSITYSIDGQRFNTLANLKVSLGNGKYRPANNKDVKKVRWQLSNALAPKAKGSVGFKTQINQNTVSKTAK